LTNKLRKKKKVKERKKKMDPMIINIALLGVLFDHIWNNYLYRLYFMPHSNLRVLYGDSMLTIDNIGKIPVEWAVITVRVNDTRSLIKGFNVTGSLDIRKPEPYAGGNYFWVVINNIAPEDWGAIEIEIEGPKGIQVEVKSSCQYEKGGNQIVVPAPTHGEWGEEESYEDWLKKRQG
jgi:hypothetical protein